MRMLSTSAGVARPVRKPRSSSRKTVTAFSMRSSASNKISSLVMVGKPSAHLTDQGADGVAGDRAFDVALALEIEHQDRQPACAAQVDGCDVHHPQIIAHDLPVSQLLVAHGV